jgi:hypothetical protein
MNSLRFLAVLSLVATLSAGSGLAQPGIMGIPDGTDINRSTTREPARNTTPDLRTTPVSTRHQGNTQDLSFAEAELQALDAAIRDLDREIEFIRNALRGNPSNRAELEAYLQQLQLLRVEYTRDRHQLADQIERARRGGSTTTPGGGTGTGSTGEAGVLWLRTTELQDLLPAMARGLNGSQAEVLGDNGQVLGRGEDLSRQRNTTAYLLAVDAIFDIEDAALRERLHAAFVRSMGNPELPFAELLAVVTQKGHDKATLRDPDIAAAFEAWDRAARSSRAPRFEMDAYIRDMLQGKDGVARFGNQNVDYDVWRRANSSLLDGLADPENVPANARAAWRVAVRDFLEFHRAATAFSLYGYDRIRGKNARDAWNRYVQSMTEYIRAYGEGTGNAPLRSRATTGVVRPGQAPPFGTVGGTGDGRVDPSRPDPTRPDPTRPDPTRPDPPRAGGPDNAVANALLERILEHRRAVQARAKEIKAVIKSDRWTDMNDWAEAFRFWEWGSAPDTSAERIVEEWKTLTFHPSENLTNRKSLVGKLKVLATIEREILQQRWVFRTYESYRQSGESDASLKRRVDALPESERIAIAIGTHLMLARRDALVILAITHRFERGDFSSLDEDATSEGNSANVALEKLFFKTEDENFTVFNVDKAIEFVRKKATSYRSGCNLNDREQLRKIDDILRLFLNIQQEWHGCRSVYPFFSMGESALRRQADTGDPLDAYRAIVLQVGLNR